MWTFNHEDLKITHRMLSWDEDMSLDVTLELNGEEVYSSNITHNLAEMARKVSEFFYKALWCPEEIGAVYAQDIVLDLRKGISTLVCAPSYYKQFNAPNGWGTFDDFVPFVVEYIEACEKYPAAIVKVWK